MREDAKWALSARVQGPAYFHKLTTEMLSWNRINLRSDYTNWLIAKNKIFIAWQVNKTSLINFNPEQFACPNDSYDSV